MKHLLIIEDDQIDQMAFERFAAGNEFNYSYEVANSIAEAKHIINTKKFDLILSDYFLGDGNAFEILKMQIDIPIIVTTGTGSEEIAVNALKMGAYDYLIKDIDGFYLKMLPITVKNALQRYQSEKELKEYHTNLEALIEQKTRELKKEIEIRKETTEDLLKMNMIFKNSNEVTFMTDINGVFTFINPKFTELYGYSQDEVIGKATPRILKSNIKNNIDYEKFWNKLTNKQSISNFSYINKRKDSTLVHIEGSFEPILDTEKSIIGYLAIQRDISERIKNQQVQKVLYNISNAVNTTKNLRQLIQLIKQELHTILDTTNFYIALYDEINNLITLPFFEDENDHFTTIPAKNSITEYIIKTKQTLLLTSQELVDLSKEHNFNLLGTTPKQWLGVPIKVAGKIIGVIVLQSYKSNNSFTEYDKDLLIYVTDQIGLSIQNKKNEQYLILALEKATESDRLKTAFLHNISHEIRTPMNGILGFANLLKNPQLSEEKQRTFIDIISKSGVRMLSTLNDLMDISKLETGQVKINYTPTNIHDELEILHGLFKPESAAKNLVLNLTLPKNKGSIVLKTDREKLFAILSNLIKNAIKFSSDGGVDFGYEQKGEFLEFYVMDTGIGIPKNRQKAIFDRFIQADINDTNVHEGSGLGLSISKSYITMLGGDIWVESIENKGSQFYFTLPIITDSKNYSKEQKEHSISPIAESKKIAVLIVEDEEIASLYLSILMEDFSSVIYRAKNGEEAIEIYKKHPEIDLVLMDIKMPKMGGYETSLMIREISKDVIIIAQTAFSFPGDKQKALRYGCTDYISKPIQATKLYALLKKYFNT
ncbi:response regulator [Lutibacter sp.]|uniref:response regulator n=1 Tax=Lutibacter sp. TaxID=1925666 RepID=UPI003569AF43